MIKICNVIKGLEYISRVDHDAKLESEYNTLTCGNAEFFSAAQRADLQRLGWELSECLSTFVFSL
jgi:hypothetical protein